MKTRLHMTSVLGLALVVGALSSCASLRKETQAEEGAAVGATTGAVVGAVIGSRSGSTAKGAILGAVIGGTAGAIIGSQMDEQADGLEDDLEDATVERVGEGIQVTFDSGILFGFDSDRLLPDAQTNLTNLAESLRDYPGTNVLVVGHTDATGSDSYNQGLSERRAGAAARFLMDRGVDADRIDRQGLGETEPVASNETEEGRALNRRVEVAIFAGDSLQNAARRRAGGF
ncbi:MAG: OmpA family protein [Gemmatimonadota bacterium]